MKRSDNNQEAWYLTLSGGLNSRPNNLILRCVSLQLHPPPPIFTFTRMAHWQFSLAAFLCRQPAGSKPTLQMSLEAERQDLVNIPSGLVNYALPVIRGTRGDRRHYRWEFELEITYKLHKGENISLYSSVRQSEGFIENKALYILYNSMIVPYLTHGVEVWASAYRTYSFNCHCTKKSHQNHQ